MLRPSQLVVTALVVMLSATSCVGGSVAPTAAPPGTAALSPSPSVSAAPTQAASAAPTTGPSRSPLVLPAFTPQPITGLAVVNSWYVQSGSEIIRPAFRIAFPPRYVATAGEMITSYLTQGGIASPILMLTTGGQPLEGKRNWVDVLGSTEECIFVWGTNGFGSIDAWHQLAHGGSTGLAHQPVGTATAIQIGRFEAVLQDIDVRGVGPRSTAYVRLSNGFSFYIHTCGTTNTADLRTVLGTLDVRPF